MSDNNASHRHRASDPGVLLSQLGQVTWVHCPSCDGPAKNSAVGVRCIRCGYTTIQQVASPPVRWATIGLDDPRCTHCRLPLPNPPRPTAREDGGKLLIRVPCPHCARTVDYPAVIAFPPIGSTMKPAQIMKLFLTTQVGGHTLWVDNLAHLDALDAWLGATLRERGPVRGKTMMARLPAWMKSATMRPKILRGLRHLRERARKAGIDE